MGRPLDRKRPSGRSPKPNRRISPAARRAEATTVEERRAPGIGWDRLGKRVRRLARPLAILALLGVVAYGGVLAHRFVLQSPHFHVKRVEVSPTVHVTADEVRKLAGIGARTNVFTVSLALVARRVERHPWVARAVARRRLPDSIRIEVTEHQAAAAVLLDGTEAGKSDFYLVTAEGRAFKRARLAELDGVPLVTGLSRQEYRVRREESQARIREALVVARHYQAQAGRPKLGEVHVDPVEGVTLYTAAPVVQLRLGRGQAATKLRRLDRVLGELAARGQRPRAIRLDNTRHPKRVTVSLAEADSGGGSR
jgi:cell division protein FtsQ